MDSPMLKMIKEKNPDKEYPSNFGTKWTAEEETTLLEELNKNMEIVLIATNHNRTPGSIHARRKDIAYKMHTSGIDMQEIIQKTKLNKEQITETIIKKEFQNENKAVKKVIKPPSSEIMKLKKEIIQLKHDMNEMYNMILKLQK